MNMHVRRDEMTRRVLDRLLKSRLRRFVYEHIHEGKDFLGDLLDMEDAAYDQAKQDWESVLQQWNLSAPDVRTSLEGIIREALRRASSETASVLSNERAPELIREYEEHFNPLSIIPGVVS